MAEEITSLFQLYGKERALKLTLEATRKLRAALVPPEDEKKLSPKAQKLKEKCISFGPSGPKWAAICSILIDEDIAIQETVSKLPFFKLACVIPVLSGDHNYVVKSPVFMCIGSGGTAESPDFIKCIKIDGSIGNNLRNTIAMFKIPNDDVIKATIEAIFKKLKTTDVKGGELF